MNLEQNTLQDHSKNNRIFRTNMQPTKVYILTWTLRWILIWIIFTRISHSNLTINCWVKVSQNFIRSQQTYYKALQICKCTINKFSNKCLQKLNLLQIVTTKTNPCNFSNVMKTLLLINKWLKMLTKVSF